MAFENKSPQEMRRLFEALLNDSMKSLARTKKEFGEPVIPEFPATFRAGFKWCLITIGLMQKSTLELSDEQMRMLCERMFELLNLPPPPDDIR